MLAMLGGGAAMHSAAYLLLPLSNVRLRKQGCSDPDFALWEDVGASYLVKLFVDALHAQRLPDQAPL